MSAKATDRDWSSLDCSLWRRRAGQGSAIEAAALLPQGPQEPALRKTDKQRHTTAESSSTTGSNQQSDICGAPSSCAVAAALMYVLPSSPAPPMHTESSCAAAEQETDVQYVWVYETNQQCMPWPTEEESQQEKLCGAMPAALNASSSWETPLMFYEAEEMYPAV